MIGRDSVADRIVSLPVEVALAVVRLLDAKDVGRLWRVSKSWNKFFQSEELCQPALKGILEETCPNFVADRSPAEQLAYHGRRMKRFYNDEPCGTTRINLNRGSEIGRLEPNRPDTYYHDGNVAWAHRIQDGALPLYRIKVLSLVDGHIFQKEQRLPSERPCICLTSCMVVAAAHGDRRGYYDNGRCFAWDLTTGEERSFQMFRHVQGFPVCHGRLVVFTHLRGQENRMLVWNYERDVTYTINVEMPASIPEPLKKFQFHPSGNAIVGHGYSYCRFTCSQGDFDELCGQHRENESITHFYSIKFSVTDGTLLSYDRKSIRTPAPKKMSAIDNNSPVNREKLYMYRSEITDSQSSASRPRTDLCEDDYPLLLSLCLYDMRSDRLIIRQYERIVSRSFLDLMVCFSVSCHPWKDTIHMEAHWSMLDCAMRTQVDSKPGEKFRVLKYKHPCPDRSRYIICVDDICTVGYEDEVIVVNWYDPIAYDKARRVSEGLV